MTPRKIALNRGRDPMDHWLDSKGFYRKHIARDGSCLFRAVAEQLFHTQNKHTQVREDVLKYMKNNEDYFERYVHEPFEKYISRMSNLNEPGGQLELNAIAFLYRVEIIVYDKVGQTPYTATSTFNKNRLLLCFCPETKQFDSIYTKTHIENSAFCQSLVYELLYKNVLNVQEVDFAVQKMLHDKNSVKQIRAMIGFNEFNRPEENDNPIDDDQELNVRELLSQGITPFPYKVAKALDPNIYRNIDFDIWSELRRESRIGWFDNGELQVGVKCLLKMAENRCYHAHIQEMAPNKGPVIVFVEEIGEKWSVPYESLEAFPQKPVKEHWPALNYKTTRNTNINNNNSNNTTNNNNSNNQVTSGQIVGRSKHRNSKSQSKRAKSKENAIPTIIGHYSSTQQQSNGFQNYTIYVGDRGQCVSSSSDSSMVHEVSMNVSSPPLPDSTTSNTGQNIHPSTTPTSQTSSLTTSTASTQPMENINPNGHSIPSSSHATPPISSTVAIQTYPPLHTTVASPITTSNSTTAAAMTIIPGKNHEAISNDLPLSDIPTLRFYYNLGRQMYYQMNLMLQLGGVLGGPYPATSPTPISLSHPPLHPPHPPPQPAPSVQPIPIPTVMYSPSSIYTSPVQEISPVSSQSNEMSSYDYEIPYATGESTEYVHPNESFPETPGLWTSPGEGKIPPPLIASAPYAYCQSVNYMDPYGSRHGVTYSPMVPSYYPHVDATTAPPTPATATPGYYMATYPPDSTTSYLTMGPSGYIYPPTQPAHYS